MGTKICIKCGFELDEHAKFCDECCAEQPVDSKQEDHSAVGIGDKNVISTGFIGNKNEVHAQTYVNNLVEDETKKIVRCCVSGRNISISESVTCKICNGNVSNEYFNRETLRCLNCERDAQESYRSEVENVFAHGLIMDSSTRAYLDNKVLELQLSREICTQIERNIKAALSQNKNNELSRGQQREFQASLDSIFEKGHSETDFRIIKSIAKDSNNFIVQYWYYLLEAIWFPKEAIKNFENKEIDIYWQHYWIFMAYLRESDFAAASRAIDQNIYRMVSAEKANEVVLSEMVYWLCRSVTDKSQYHNAEQLAKELHPVGGELLALLEKSARFIIRNFNNVDPDKVKGAEAFYLQEVFRLSNANSTKNVILPVSQPVLKKATDSSGQHAVAESVHDLQKPFANNVSGAYTPPPPTTTHPYTAPTVHTNNSKKFILGGVAAIAAIYLGIYLFSPIEQTNSSPKTEQSDIDSKTEQIVEQKKEITPEKQLSEGKDTNTPLKQSTQQQDALTQPETKKTEVDNNAAQEQITKKVTQQQQPQPPAQQVQAPAPPINAIVKSPHPDLEVKVVKAVESGGTLIIDMLVTNHGADEPFEFYGSLPSVVYYFTDAIDNEGNVYNSDSPKARISVGQSGNMTMNHFDISLSEGVPVKLRVQLTNLSKNVTQLAQLRIMTLSRGDMAIKLPNPIVIKNIDFAKR